jgi:hypothetical protein
LEPPWESIACFRPYRTGSLKRKSRGQLISAQIRRGWIDIFGYLEEIAMINKMLADAIRKHTGGRAFRMFQKLTFSRLPAPKNADKRTAGNGKGNPDHSKNACRKSGREYFLPIRKRFFMI